MVKNHYKPLLTIRKLSRPQDHNNKSNQISTLPSKLSSCSEIKQIIKIRILHGLLMREFAICKLELRLKLRISWISFQI